MKTIFRVLMLGLVTAVTGTIAFAQVTTATPAATPTPTVEACTFEQQSALYAKFQAGRKSQNLADIKAGVQAGEEFLAKCATAEQQVVVDHIKKFLPEQKLKVVNIETSARFNNAINDPKNLKADEAFSSSKALMEQDPGSALDVMITLARLGLNNAEKNPPVDKYNNEAILMAKKVISELDAGKTAKIYGAYSFSTAIKNGEVIDHPKSKNNTIGWMNYIIGSIMYFNQKMEKDALPYFYKTTQIDSDKKTDPFVYRTIGAWFAKEIIRINKEREAKIAANGDKDNEETLAMDALIKGYAERGINAYAKAHKIASAVAKTPPQLAIVKALYDTITGLYEVRFNKKDGLDAYLATASAQPLIDPAIPVAPVIEVVPATTTTSSTTNPPTTPATTNTTTKPVTTTPVTTKPAVTTPTTTTKPGTTTTKPTSTTTTKPAGTTKPKATVNKKKGAK